jgi:hypothetical protein
MNCFLKGASILAFSLTTTAGSFPAIAKPTKIPAEQLEGKQHISVIPGKEYEAGALHTLIFGTHWRSLWTTPVEITVLDLKSFGGGLVPFEKGGGFQTKTLSFKGANGKEYRFRSLDKDPARGIPPKLQNTAVSAVVQDQVSSSNPVSALVVSPLLESTGSYQVTPELTVLPYDKGALGEYFDEFAGLAGTIEERPTESDIAGAGFKGADKISGTYAVFNNLEKDNDNHVDEAAYLRARLIDLFIGDWDRHSDQWKWAGYKKEGKTRWVPIPRDRDHAFSRHDGVFSWIITKVMPRMTGFKSTYPSVKHLTLSARHLDRRLLSGIDRAEWDAITRDVQEKLTDSVISEAVRKMPPAMYEKEGAQLEHDLRMRRDLLKAASHELYLLYAEDVDIYASNKPEYAGVRRMPDGQVEVAVSKRDAATGAEKGNPFYFRRFNPLETEEVRIYLQGGDDRVVVQGPVCKDGVKVRVIGGEGLDIFEDHSEKALSGYPYTAEKMTCFYDDGKKSEFTSGAFTSIDQHTVADPADDEEKYDLRDRDSGRDTGMHPLVGYSPDSGVFLGLGVTVADYGFRSDPYRYKIDVSGGVAYGKNDFRNKLQFKGDFRTVLRNASLLVEAGSSGLDLINFYGLGNERYYHGSSLREDDFEIVNTINSIRTSLRYPMDKQYNWSAGISAKWVDLVVQQGSFIDLYRSEFPGIDRQFVGGVHLGFHYDSRDCGDAIALSPGKKLRFSGGGEPLGNTTALQGTMLDVEGSYYPEFFGNEKAFGKIRGEVRTYIPLVSSRYSRVALRAGGEKIWGEYPFYEAAFVGGTHLLRGYDKQRFAGDASIYAGSELRLYFGTFKFLVPVMYGPLAFIETGRVFLKGEDSGAWHTSVGGGLWLGFIESRYTASISFAKGLDDGQLMDDYGIYIGTGFTF